jgi:hypothetical protein
MAHGNSAKKKGDTISLKKAKSAAAAAAQLAQPGKTATAWQKGGKEWSRVLGHFGPPARKRA